MAKGRTRWSPLEKVLLATAQELDRAKGDRAPAEIGRLAAQAMLIKRLLLDLSQDENLQAELGAEPTGKGLAQWWQFCAQAGCPLLADADGLSADVLDAIEEFPAQQDLGQLYQMLQEAELQRNKSGELALLRGRTRRRRSGLFFTPDWMATRLTEMVLTSVAGVNIEDLRILDPACGSGRLLLACLDRLLDGLNLAGAERSAAGRQLAGSILRGVDLDPMAATLARTELWLRADPRQGPVAGLDQAIVTGDTLAGPLPPEPVGKGEFDWAKHFPAELVTGSGFDLVVANPPFEVLKGFSRRQGLKHYVARIRQSGYQLALCGSLNTYRLFLERSLALLRDGGRLGFVLPYGFLMDRTAAPLRAHMLRSGWLRRVELFPESARSFEKVGQSVVLMAAEKTTGGDPSLLVADGTRPGEEHRVCISDLAALCSETLPIPASSSSACGLAAKMSQANQSCIEELADGRVGEVDQSFYRQFMSDEVCPALLIRGCHLMPYHAELSTDNPHERWLDLDGFDQARGPGRWRQDVLSPRVVQTGIVNMEAKRRLVAAVVPEEVYLGNSLNYWTPKPQDSWDLDLLRAYLLGLLNSVPLEWRFRLTSSNNNINLYEVRSLPIPRLTSCQPAEWTPRFLDESIQIIQQSRDSVLGTVRQITSGWGAPARDDRVVGKLIGRLALLREAESEPERGLWLDGVLDHMVNWHLGMDEPDLDRMLADMPTRAGVSP